MKKKSCKLFTQMVVAVMFGRKQNFGDHLLGKNISTHILLHNIQTGAVLKKFGS